MNNRNPIADGLVKQFGSEGIGKNPIEGITGEVRLIQNMQELAALRRFWAAWCELHTVPPGVRTHEETEKAATRVLDAAKHVHAIMLSREQGEDHGI